MEGTMAHIEELKTLLLWLTPTLLIVAGSCTALLMECE